jgi:hypothetical protein
VQRVLDRLRPPAIGGALILLAAPYLGMLWEWIAPAPTYVNLSGEVYLNNQDSSEFIAADGWFLILGLLAGVLSAVLGYWRWRANLAVIVAMGLAAVPAAYIAREVGEAFGPAPIQQTALSLASGATIHGEITVGARGVLFAWAVGVLITYLSLVGGLDRTEAGDEAEPVGWEQPGWELENGELVSPNGADEVAESAASETAASVGVAGLAGDVGAGQRRQMGEHDPLPAEKGELGP